MTSPPRPWHRNPYLWAAAIGIALITFTRPLTRHIPPPAPAFDTLPSLSLKDLRGELFSLPGRDPKAVWVMHTASAGCGDPCAPARVALEGLAGRAKRESLEVLVVSVVMGEDDTMAQAQAVASAHPALRVVLPASKQDRDALRAATRATALGLAPPHDTLSPFLTLIDGQGRVRGHYPYDADGIDELFHRAKRLRAP